MSTKQLSAGDIIDARCTRCRDILNHRIVAMVGDKVVRVECNTCGGVHNYYPPPSLKPDKSPRAGSTPRASSAATPRTPRKDPHQSEREEWLSLRSSMRFDRSIAYKMDAKFAVDDVVDHPTFGFGVVKLVVAPNKMQVLFEDGIKLLRCK